MKNSSKKTKFNLFLTLSLTILQLFPCVYKLLCQLFYDRLSEKNDSKNLPFMNYGFSNNLSEIILQLSSDEELWRNQIQLYNHTLNKIETKNKDILEVGCGRGGGGSFIIRYKNPKSYIGIDISKKSIAHCNQNLNFPNATWLQGAADKLPIIDNSIDIAINVESSHCYPSMKNFISEIQRILKPNGYFAFCDLRLSDELKTIDKLFLKFGFVVIIREDISSNVLMSLNSISHLDKEFSKNTPVLYRLFNNIIGRQGSPIYEMLMNKELQYMYYLLHKPAEIEKITLYSHKF